LTNQQLAASTQHSVPERYLLKDKFAMRVAEKKLNAIDSRNEGKKELRQAFDSPFELRLGFCLQQNILKGGGVGKGTDRAHG
jgi:hypothetical protein